MDVGLEIAMPRLRTIGYVERDAYAAAVLMERMENETLGRAPVFCGDIADLDARPFAGVDILSASPPCQPYSQAGQRKGNRDERSHGDGTGPIVHLLRVIRECGPGVIFFENVPPWVAAGHFQSVRAELLNMGYRIKRPLFLAASDVGAPHKRERVFIMAHADGAERRPVGVGGIGSVKGNGREREQKDGRFGIADETLAHRTGGGCRELRESSGPDRQPDGGGEAMAHAKCLGRTQGNCRDQVTETEVITGRCGALFPPAPTGDWTGIPEWLWPAIPEGQTMALASGDRCGQVGTASATNGAGQRRERIQEGDQPSPRGGTLPVGQDSKTTEPGFRVMAYGTAVVVDENRSDQLRCIGNAVVPQQVATAFAVLASEEWE